MTDNLFDDNNNFCEITDSLSVDAPLAARMRPRTLEEYVGQDEELKKGKPLYTAIMNDALTSVILWGPAGCGKTTLAHIIARYTASTFVPFSAVTSGVPELRKIIQAAKEQKKFNGKKTLLFVDEIHRFNKSQQDAFLPVVEDGTITLLGATTENPYFEINSPLLSRSRLVILYPLTEENVRIIIKRALTDSERGLGSFGLTISDEALRHLAAYSGGDARIALNALAESAALTKRGKEITLETVELAISKHIYRYDKKGDMHYDIISAFIKSMRGSDPDAALYWMARMLAGGEDPKFIARRIVICAAEDVGNADPLALTVATSAVQALEFVGMPEARIPLAQAVCYVATAPKSNAAYMAVERAMRDVEDGKLPPVPKDLRSTSYKGARQLKNGENYKYPHDFPGHHVKQEYLPKSLRNVKYYEPSDQGFEAKLRQRLERWKSNENKD